MQSHFKKVAVFHNQRKDMSVQCCSDVSEFLRAKGLSVEPVPCMEHGPWSHEADLVITVGGDGTVLHAARDLAGHNIPILGLNSGTLGFLTAVEMRDFRARIESVLAGEFVIQERFLLQAEVYKDGVNVSGQQVAFNDCVIRTMEPRAMMLSARLGKALIKNYLGDGLIVASPTGSTAYALAALGPIVYPTLDVMVLAPICPHTLTQRPLVVPAAEVITVVPNMGHGDFRRHPILSIDGQINITLNPGDEVRVSQFPRKVKMLIPPDYDYFKVLNDKLNWGDR